jgi:hypothetical protein
MGVLPGASEFSGLIPDLLKEGIVLDDDSVLNERALGPMLQNFLCLLLMKAHDKSLSRLYSLI